MATVAITQPIIEAGLVDIAERYTLRMPDELGENPPSEEELIEVGQDAEALITSVGDPVTARVIENCPNLRIIAHYAVGYDNIDLEAAREAGIVVTHTPDVLTDATADLAFGLLLSVARRLREADSFTRNGSFERWGATLLLGTELSGSAIGIVGMGRIGAAVARRARGFGMDIIYHNRSRGNPTTERRVSARYVSLDELIETSDVISLHCPLNEESHHLIDEAAFKKMKATALLINTARGEVVDEQALVDALDNGEIAGAGLDVFEDEPQVHPGLLEHDRVMLSPHIGSATVQTRTKMGEMCGEAIISVLEDAEKIPYRVV